MAVIVTRSGKGAPLTNSELDSNFNNLNTSVTTGAEITGGTINGTTIGASTPSTGAFTDFSASGTAAFTSTGAVKIPVGTQLQRPTPSAGMLRFNDDIDEFEGYNGTAWISLGGSGYTSKTISENTTLNADTEYETGRNLRINFGVKLTVPNTTLLVVHNYATGLSL